MPTSDERITELEMRYTLQQDLLEQLSAVLREHGREFERLRRELEVMRSRQNESPNPINLDDKPPHY